MSADASAAGGGEEGTETGQHEVRARHVLKHLASDDDVEGLVGEGQPPGDVTGDAMPSRALRRWHDIHADEDGVRREPPRESGEQDPLSTAEVEGPRGTFGRHEVGNGGQPSVEGPDPRDVAPVVVREACHCTPGHGAEERGVAGMTAVWQRRSLWPAE